LISIFIFIGGEDTGAELCVIDLTLFNPYFSWDRKNNPHLWEKLCPKYQLEVLLVNVDYSKLKKEGSDAK
jgi:hypothetical protein